MIDMRIANLYVKDLFDVLNTCVLIHMVAYDDKYCPDYIGKLSELPKHCMYNDIYNARVDRIFFSFEDRKYLNIYVSLRGE